MHALTVHVAQTAPPTVGRVTCLRQRPHRLAEVRAVDGLGVTVALVEARQVAQAVAAPRPALLSDTVLETGHEAGCY